MIKKYIVYLESGEIIETGSIQEEWFASKVGEGQYIMEGVASASEHKIVDGNIVPRLDTDFIETIPLEEQITLTAELIREERLKDLQSSDWTQMPDSPLSDAKKAEWAVYRQKLRDLPSLHVNATDYKPIFESWPEEPDA